MEEVRRQQLQKADGREEPTGQWPLSAPLTGQGCLPALGDLCFREEPWGTLSGAVFCTCGQDVAWQQAASGAALGQVTGERGARPPHPSPAHPCALVLLVRGEALFRCARPSGVPRGPATSTSLTTHICAQSKSQVCYLNAQEAARATWLHGTCVFGVV